MSRYSDLLRYYDPSYYRLLNAFYTEDRPQDSQGTTEEFIPDIPVERVTPKIITLKSPSGNQTQMMVKPGEAMPDAYSSNTITAMKPKINEMPIEKVIPRSITLKPPKNDTKLGMEKMSIPSMLTPRKASNDGIPDIAGSITARTASDMGVQPIRAFSPMLKNDKENEVVLKKGMTRAEFVKSNYNKFKKAYEKVGLNPDVAMAQAILESGIMRYGGNDSVSGLALRDKNMFGIKAVKGEKSVRRATKEERDGVYQDEMANFVTNPTYSGSLQNHINFLSKYNRYSGLFNNKSQEDILNKLQASGYATDTQYSNKLRQIINKDILPNI